MLRAPIDIEVTGKVTPGSYANGFGPQAKAETTALAGAVRDTVAKSPVRQPASHGDLA